MSNLKKSHIKNSFFFFIIRTIRENTESNVPKEPFDVCNSNINFSCQPVSHILFLVSSDAEVVHQKCAFFLLGHFCKLSSKQDTN